MTLYGVTTLLIALVALPFAEPDGYVHWWRMQALGHGHVLPEATAEGASGIAVQVSDSELKERLVPFITRTDIKVRPKRWAEILAITDKEPLAVQYEGAGAFASAPTFYAVPTVLAVGADWLIASEYGAVILYRVLFVLLSLVIIAWLIPSSCFAIAAFCCVPTVQFLVATGHLDAVAFLALMSAAALVQNRRRWLSLPIITFASKSAVALLAPFFLIAAYGLRRGMIISVPVLALIATVYGVYSAWLGPIVDARVFPGVAPTEQLQTLFAEPTLVFEIGAHTLLQNSTFYFRSMIGLLGWLDAPVPVWSYLAVLLVSAAIATSHTVPRTVLLAWLVSSAVYCAATFAAIYLTWTPVGAMAVLGVQGRYFLPVFAAIAPLLAPRLDLSRFVVPALLLAGALQIQTLFTLADRYYHLEYLPYYYWRLVELWT